MRHENGRYKSGDRKIQGILYVYTLTISSSSSSGLSSVVVVVPAKSGRLKIKRMRNTIPPPKNFLIPFTKHLHPLEYHKAPTR